VHRTGYFNPLGNDERSGHDHHWDYLDRRILTSFEEKSPAIQNRHDELLDFLVSQGHTAHQAANGREAIDWFKGRQTFPGLIFLDLASRKSRSSSTIKSMAAPALEKCRSHAIPEISQ
jgi:hypothetical protein